MIRPIAEAVDLGLARRRAGDYLREMMGTATYLGNGLYLLDGPASRATPSMLSLDCWVKGLIRLRMGNVVDVDSMWAMAMGRAVHDLYEGWFRNVNPDIHVESEAGVEYMDTSGRADILYMRDDGDGEVWGLIELKSTWRLDKDRETRYIRQMAAYAELLSQVGIELREGYVVTMRRVMPIPAKALRDGGEVLVELRRIEEEDWPSEPPNPSVCPRCSLRSLCRTYAGWSPRT